MFLRSLSLPHDTAAPRARALLLRALQRGERLAPTPLDVQSKAARRHRCRVRRPAAVVPPQLVVTVSNGRSAL